MIGLKGRHPPRPFNFVSQSAADASAVLAKAGRTALRIFREEDFPNHWGKHKHLFLVPQYNGKCAYCETPVAAAYPGDVEHFRPKAYCRSMGPAKNRDDYGGLPPDRRSNGPAIEGYWWLAYEWKNYLLSCNRCNATWKRNQFPIQGVKANYGDRLSTEKALVINPYKTDPERHFAFDPNTGQISGLTPHGKATIDVCGLDRRSLEVQRAMKGAKLIKRHDEYVQALSQRNTLAQNNTLRALLDECRNEEPYAAVARYFVKTELHISYPQLLVMEQSRII